MNEIPPLPSGQLLPLAYRWFRAHGLMAMTPWHFIDDAEYVAWWREQNLKHSGRDSWPFAYRQNRMETAAFPIRCGRVSGRVVIWDDDRSDQMSSGGRSHPIERFRSFEAWLLDAIKESTGEWMTEEELAGYLE